MRIIIGLLGKARAGKDLTGKLLKELHPGVETIALADPIKSIGKKLFAFNDLQCYGGKEKEEPDTRYGKECPKCGGKGQVNDAIYCGTGYDPPPRWTACAECRGTGIKFLTPRWAFQYIGTEVARELYPNVWVEYGLRAANELFNGYMKTAPDHFEVATCDRPRVEIVAFTDVRFINECKLIREAGGAIWRITRPGIEDKLSGASKTHASEMEQTSKEIEQYVNETIANDGSIEQMRGRVADALGKLLA